MKNQIHNFNLFKAILILFIFLLKIDFINAEELKVLKEKTFSSSAGKNLKLETSVGDIKISTWNKNDVYVKILGNSKAEDKVDFLLDSDDNGVTIIGKKESSWLSWSFSNINVKYEIILPTKYNAYLSTAGGDIKIKDLDGKIELKTSGGDIKLENLSGICNGSTSGGDIVSKNLKCNSSFSTSGGDIKIENFLGDIEVSTSGGDIELSGSNGKVDASTSGGDINLDFSGSNKGIELSTSGGDITLRVPSDFSADATLKTFGGSITCELPTSNVTKISASRFEAELNKGGNKLICKTSGGDISVKKK